MSDYKPISCHTYAELEVAILHQVRLRLGWRMPDGGVRLEAVQPVDLNTRNHEEYLVIEEDDGVQSEIRLDRIVGFQPL